MSGWGTKNDTKWDSKEDTRYYHHSSVNARPASYYRDKEPPETAWFNAESNGSRRSAAADDQHSGETRSRSRVAQSNDDNYYSEPDETRQPFLHRSGSSSISRSRSRSRSPVYRARRDARPYDRHQTSREFNRSSGYGLNRKPREMKYDSDGFREQAMMKGSRSSGYCNDGVSDPRLTRHRSKLTEEKETQRRYGDGDGDGDGDGEGEFQRSSNIPCKFFAGGAGFCRNGDHCRFSHHHVADRKQPQDNNFYRGDNNNHSGHNRWNDVEKMGGNQVSRASKGVSEIKGSSWIDDMEMSPDWNYGVQSLKNPVKEEHGGVGQSSQSRLVKDNLVTNYDQRSNGMFSYGQNYSKPAAQVQAFDQNTLPCQNGGSQQVVAVADVLVSSELRDPESGNIYQNSHHLMVEKAVPVANTVTREQIDQISNMSASIAQFLANGQPIPNLTQALQIPLHLESSSMAVQSNQATTALRMMSSNTNQLCGLGTSTEGVPVVTASQVDGVQTPALNPKAENGDKRTDETSKEEDGKKNGQDGKDDAEEVVDDEDDDDEDDDDDDDEADDGSDEENKKGKDAKAFKFALVEIVKELLNHIVKKVVEKVTGTMQSGNVPQTQDKIDHYLSSSKPKLTKLVQAYISKVKKN